MPTWKVLLISTLFQDVGLRTKKQEFRYFVMQFDREVNFMKLSPLPSNCQQTETERKSWTAMKYPATKPMSRSLMCLKGCNKNRMFCLQIRIHKNGKLILCLVSRNWNVLKLSPMISWVLMEWALETCLIDDRQIDAEMDSIMIDPFFCSWGDTRQRDLRRKVCNIFILEGT